MLFRSEILRENHIKVIVINRSEKGLEILSQSGFDVALSEDFIPSKSFDIESFDLVINSTSAGLKDSSLPLDSKKLSALFSSSKVAFDLIYGIETPFLSLAKSFDIQVKDGGEMLINQAVLAFYLFCDKRVSIKDIDKYMRYIF